MTCKACWRSIPSLAYAHGQLGRMRPAHLSHPHCGRPLHVVVQAGKGFGASVTKTKDVTSRTPKAPSLRPVSSWGRRSTWTAAVIGSALDNLPASVRRLLERRPPGTAKDGRPLVTPGKVTPMRHVPDHIPKPPWYRTGIMPNWTERTEVHDDNGIMRMRASGRLAAETLQFAGSLIKPGITTEEIDEQVHRFIIERGAYPSPLNYGNFPKSVCTSVNEVICHGIPDSRQLQNGDIVNVDVTVYLDGYHGDTSQMFYVGEVSEQARHLCEVTEMALLEAIKICKPNTPIKMIGATIQAVADKHKMGVVKDFVGHGVGRVFHASPMIQHRRNNAQGVMKLNQTFTIEPMLVAPGGSTGVKMWNDKWTAVTADGSLTAQFEHTILITKDGAEILTKL